MPDENEKLTEDQGQPEPGTEKPQPQAQEPVYEVGGEKIPASQLLSRYQASVKGMNEAQERAAVAEKSLDEVKSRWDPIEQRYVSDSEFRTAFEEAWTGGEGQERQPAPLDPRVQDLELVKRDNLLLKMRFDFNDLRAKGHELTPEMENQIFTFVRANPKYTDTTMVYRHLFWDKNLTTAREQAVSTTAERLKKGKGAYTAPPEGGHKPETPINVKEMSHSERLKAGIERAKEFLEGYNE